VEISRQEFDQLQQQLRELTARVYQLERTVSRQTRPIAEHQSPPADLFGPPPLPPISETLRPGPAQPQTPPLPRSPEVHPAPRRSASADLESRIGSHWLNRIGIAAVLVGVSFFLNYAFENNWIGPAGRIVIGLLAGIAVVLWSERFRKRGYSIFSYSLKAVGIGVLYLSLWAAFQVYHLLPSGAAFAGMVVVTACTCAMAFAQNAELLAAFAIAGGFSTPVLVSTGENRELVLFTYLAILDGAILSLTILKPWRRMPLLGFVGTLSLYIAWYNTFYEPTQLAPTLTFATVFFAIFTLSSLLIVRRGSPGKLPAALALINGVTYFAQGYVMLKPVSSDETAFFSLALAAFYLTLIRVRPRGSDTGAETSVRLIHLALAIGLITVAIPVRLEAHAITIGWLVEAAALLWVGGRIKSDLLNWFAIFALLLGIGRLLLWDAFAPTQLIFNTRMASYVVACAVLGFAAYQCGRRKNETWRFVAGAALIALNLLALRALSLEAADYYARQIPGPARNMWRPEALARRRAVLIARDFTYSALWMAYGAMLMIIGFGRGSAFVRWQALVLVAVTTLKVFVYDTSQLDHIYRILSLVALGVLLLAISFAYQRRWIKLPST
jgi:uncharacterized membrane protein